MRWITRMFVLAALGAALGAGPARATFPGHNGRIAFATQFPGSFAADGSSGPIARPSDCGPAQAGVIRTVAPNGLDSRQVGPPDPSAPNSAVWSPHGRQLAIESTVSDCNYDGMLQIFSTGGVAIRGIGIQFSFAGPALTGWASERRLLLSFPDGSTNGFAAGVWETTLSAKPLRLIARGAHGISATTDVVDAAASARGAIVFVRRVIDGIRSGDIRLLLQRRRSVHLADGEEPDWAPDARHLVYERDGDLWIVNSRTLRTRRLTSTRKVTEENPVWSPDGRQIAFDAAARNAGVTSVYTMPSGGGSARLLVPDGGDPSWQSIP